MEKLNRYSETELLFALKQDDVQAFEIIYDQYWPLLFNTTCKYINDKETAKEIVHDVLLDIWQRRQTLEINNLQAYLITAVRFRTINYVSRSKAPAFFELFDSIATAPESVEQKLLEKETLDLIQSWIETLPEKRKEIFVKHFFHQLSTREIANSMNISQKTVQNQVGTALRFIRARFGHLLNLLLHLLLLFFPD